MNTVVNAFNTLGDPASMEPPWVPTCILTTYQGAVEDKLQFWDQAAYTASTDNPVTGSIVSLNSQGKAVCDVPTGTGANQAVPYIVKVGCERPEIRSERGNASGGVITILPMTGFYRFRTTIFDKTQADYARGDFLTIKTSTLDGKSVCLVTKENANVYTTVTVGVVDLPVANDREGNPALSFTAMWVPVKVEAGA